MNTAGDKSLQSLEQDYIALPEISEKDEISSNSSSESQYSTDF